MVAEPLVIEFHEDERAAVVKRMVTMAAKREGWINFSPGLDVDQPPPQRSPLSGLFTARGPDVPLGTWSPPERRSERDPATVGVHHGQGPRTIEMLAAKGLALPDGWRRLQDHPRRGLVLAVPPSTDPDELDATLQWLLTATGLLCPIRRTGEWRALCYRAL
ncbi:MAG TPA: hypothetical protein VK611_24640 [Acidimicrobiales bacterium]|nr:hypothetical protein [Acidimicrobiales bacterium]